jgi:uncharacterized lipoprotein YddW (UPF0748 family)
MKKIVIVLLSLVMITSIIGGENEEFRAVWVVSWEHISSSSSVKENQARVRQILDNLVTANMNAVLWHIRQSGTVYYNSSYEPWGSRAGYQYPGYDPLEYAIEEAHKRGLELHAWFNVFQVSSVEPTADPLPPALQHPNWVCRDGEGDPMPAHRSFSPGLDSVRAYTVNVAMEIVNNYDIDGLHLDYVRWNEYDNESVLTAVPSGEEDTDIIDGLNFVENTKYKNTPDEIAYFTTDRYLWDLDHPYSAGIPDGLGSWEEYWRGAVTEFVEALHDSIQSVKPYVRLSAAALGKYNWSFWNGYHSAFQDAALWFNEGFIDQLIPMHYHWTTPQGFYDMLEGDCPTDCWGSNLQTGINAGRLFSVGPGSYKFDDSNDWDNHPSIVDRCRMVEWTDGFQFFSYASWNGHQYWDDAGLLFFKQKTKVRSAKFLNDSQPDSPSITAAKLDSLTYEITVNPPGTIETNQRFAIYRSEDDTLDIEKDEIIDIHFGESTYTITDSLDGWQNFDGHYTYYATMFNRFWNESSASNSFTSDQIPSFAPLVIASSPVTGDTVKINSGILLTFSKSMDVNTFTDNISISPDVEILSQQWTYNQTILALSFLNNLEHATDYSLTISKDVTDQIGMQLDGNGDGLGGDDFVLTFRTKDVDVSGPVPVFFNPDSHSDSTGADIADVITLAFDELIDPATVTETSVSVKQDALEVPVNIMVFDSYNDQSVITIQADKVLEPARPYSVTFENTIADVSGNPMDSTFYLDFETEPYIYIEGIRLDDFIGLGAWESPDYSGSTNGVDPANSYFRITGNTYLPATKDNSQQKTSGELHYVWEPAFLDPPGSDYLLRDYLNVSPPREVTFDTTYILQCYVFGDGSGNKFRFALDDKVPVAAAENHEVSPWYTIDWIGWKVINWDLSEGKTGEWLGDGNLDGTLRMDSFQLTHVEGAAVSGTVYFKYLRLKRKEYNTVGSVADVQTSPIKYRLSQNYPNPFNPVTKIDFSIAERGETKLTIYDVLGQTVRTMVNGNLERGDYSVSFDGSRLASGVYFYVLRSKNIVLQKKMMLLK